MPPESQTTPRPDARSVMRAACVPLGVVLIFPAVAHAVGNAFPADSLFHFIGGLAGMYFLEQVNAAWPGLLGRPGAGALRLLAFCMTCTVALFWEFGELALDLLAATRLQQPGLDTLSDLAFGAAGAAVFAMTSYARERLASARPDATRYSGSARASAR